MLVSTGVTVRFGKRILFEDVNIRFGKGNCYGIIGANRCWKIYFLESPFSVNLNQVKAKFH